MTPHECPVCNGNGIVDAGFYTQTSGYWTSTGGTEMCRACNGTGIVWEKQAEGMICHPHEPNETSLRGITTTDAGPYWGLSGGGE